MDEAFCEFEVNIHFSESSNESYQFAQGLIKKPLLQLTSEEKFRELIQKTKEEIINCNRVMDEMLNPDLRPFLSEYSHEILNPYAILIITETTKHHTPPFEDKLSCIEVVIKITYDIENNEFHAKLME